MRPLRLTEVPIGERVEKLPQQLVFIILAGQTVALCRRRESNLPFQGIHAKTISRPISSSGGPVA